QTARVRAGKDQTTSPVSAEQMQLVQKAEQEIMPAVAQTAKPADKAEQMDDPSVTQAAAVTETKSETSAAPGVPSDARERASELLKQAKQARDKGDYDKAVSLCEQAKQLQSQFGFTYQLFEET